MLRGLSRRFSRAARKLRCPARQTRCARCRPNACRRQAVGGAELTARLDYSFRDVMYGEPSSDSGRFTQIDSRELINMDLRYAPAQGDWSVSLYAQNLLDERYDNARLNTGDNVLRILSNDARELGVRYTVQF